MDFIKFYLAERTGWHKNVFVLPDGVIGAGEGEKIVLQTLTPYNPFLVAGTLEEWRNTIGQWSRGNSRLMLALCASLAAPLLEASGQESGGFNPRRSKI